MYSSSNWIVKCSMATISLTSKSSVVYQGFVQLIIFRQEKLQIKLGFVHESHHPQCCYHCNITALFEAGEHCNHAWLWSKIREQWLRSCSQIFRSSSSCGRQKPSFLKPFWSSETSNPTHNPDQPNSQPQPTQSLKVPCCTSLFPCTRCTANMASKGFSVACTASTKSCWLCTRRALNQLHLAFRWRWRVLNGGYGPCNPESSYKPPENSYETQRIGGYWWFGSRFLLFQGIVFRFQPLGFWGWREVYIVHTPPKKNTNGPKITRKKIPTI